MAKEKVYKLAQEFKVSSEALVQILRGMGIPVKSHMSTVDDSLRDEIKTKFEQERAEIKKEYVRKRQKIAKKREEMIAAAEPPKTEEAKPRESEEKPRVTGERDRRRPRRRARPPRSRGEVYEAPRPEATPAQSTDPTDSPKKEQPSRTDRSDRKKGRKKGKQKRHARPEVDSFQVKSTIKKTLAKIGAGSARKKYKKDSNRPEAEEQADKTILNVSEFVTANELAQRIGKPVSEVIAKCLELGLFVTINQRLDFETIELLADEFGYTAKLMEEYATDADEELDEKIDESTLRPRAPVVTVMGHVDHGKTSLLDYIRSTNVIAGESGGITQHIAAYEVVAGHGSVTFLDTPGHEAFTAMRARGSQITDVIVLVVAADSGVMPQTKEAIDHAKAANVPIVVAINKTDLPTANIDKVKSELARYNVAVEEYGGQISSVEISAKTGNNVDKLLEILTLETEMLDLKSTKEGKANGVVIEAELDRGRGSIATVLIQRGTLRRGDPFVTGIHNGRVRDLLNERGMSIDEAGPSQPCVVLGMTGTPQAGDSFRVTEDERQARDISARRRLAQKEHEIRRLNTVSLDHLYEQIQEGKVQSLNLIIKGDVDGSVEALAESLLKLSTDEIRVNVISKSVGAVKEADIMLATASNAIIVGFHLSPNTKIRELAKKEGVEIRTFRIIYEAVEEVKQAMEGMLAPEIKEEALATIEIRELFKISKFGLVAGCMVTNGTVTRGNKARVIRDDIEIADTRIGTLRRHKDDVKEVQSGYECGVTFEGFSDFKQGDRIEAYKEVEVARTL
ncbi:MAG: translation initiation factor IF-2 [Chitinivibrionales bacterium]|nr:translation initiation factor IF-2 [Chitinivibrionales bacterium]